MIAPHIVIDPRRHELHCERCRTSLPLTRGVEPAAGWLEATADLVARFSAKHEGCAPRPVDLVGGL